MCSNSSSGAAAVRRIAKRGLNENTQKSYIWCRSEKRKEGRRGTVMNAPPPSQLLWRRKNGSARWRQKTCIRKATALFFFSLSTHEAQYKKITVNGNLFVHLATPKNSADAFFLSISLSGVCLSLRAANNVAIFRSTFLVSLPSHQPPRQLSWRAPTSVNVWQ
jgi:hypothetical protein